MCHTERWMSGLNQRFTKPSSLKQDREFESRSLRRDNITLYPALSLRLSFYL